MNKTPDISTDGVKQMMEWLPIESAPKDGTIIDLFIKSDSYSGRSIDYYWQAKRKIWRNVRGPDVHPRNVTHWMPQPGLPARPETNDHKEPKP